MAKKKKRKITDVVSDHLHDDEVILWMGKPDPLKLLTNNDWMVIPFSIVWCGTVFWWLYSAFATFGLLFALGMLLIPHYWVAFWLFPLRFIYEYQRRQRTSYIITDQRVMILSGVFKTPVTSLYLDQLPERKLSIDRNGNGTIKFKRLLGNNRQPTAATDFFNIEDVVWVNHLIQEAHDDYFRPIDLGEIVDDTPMMSRDYLETDSVQQQMKR